MTKALTKKQTNSNGFVPNLTKRTNSNKFKVQTPSNFPNKRPQATEKPKSKTTATTTATTFTMMKHNHNNKKRALDQDQDKDQDKDHHIDDDEACSSSSIDNKKKDKEKYTLSRPTFERERFLAANVEEAYENLRRYGVAVLPSGLSEEFISKTEDGVFSTLEGCYPAFRRNDTSTWGEITANGAKHGMLVQTLGLGWSQPVVDCRQNPAIVQIFASLWDCRARKRHESLVRLAAASTATTTEEVKAVPPKPLQLNEMLCSSDGISTYLNTPDSRARFFRRDTHWLHWDRKPQLPCSSSSSASTSTASSQFSSPSSTPPDTNNKTKKPKLMAIPEETTMGAKEKKKQEKEEDLAKWSVQSFINLFDTIEGGAAFHCFPKSHLHQTEFAERFDEKDRFNLLKNQAQADFFIKEKGCENVCIQAKRGDMVFWDSRTIHCGRVADRDHIFSRIYNDDDDDAKEPAVTPQSLRRCVIYVSMQPRVLATERDLELKRRAHEQLRSTTHNAASGVELFPIYPRVRCAADDARKKTSQRVSVAPKLTFLGRWLFGLVGSVGSV